MKKQIILQPISFWGNDVIKYNDNNNNNKKSKDMQYSISFFTGSLFMVQEWCYCMSQQKTTTFSLLPATKASKYQCFYMKSLLTMKNKTIMIYVVFYLNNTAKHPDQSHQLSFNSWPTRAALESHLKASSS